jgi:hypothetical protein
MIDCRFRPLDRWPREKTPSYKQRDAPFRAGYTDTLDLLEKELNYLKAKDVVVEADFAMKDIRNDGWPRSSARTKSPGVILSFGSRYGAMTLPCDQFTAWEDNLRAIAFHLHHLRKSDLYGVSQAGEQYKGWTALPPAPTQTFDNRHAAAMFLYNHSNGAFHPATIESNADAREQAYRLAAKRLHPDVQMTGDTKLFQYLQDAITLLRS